MIPAAGHAVNIDQPQAFIDAVLPFLDGLDARRREGRVMKTVAAGPVLIAGSLGASPRSNCRSAAPTAAFHRNAVEQHAAGLRHGRRKKPRARSAPAQLCPGPAGRGNLLAFRNIGGSGLFYKKDRLFLQFRKGRLAGWKGDWGHNWMWQ